MDPAALRPELRHALCGASAGQFTPIVQIPEGFAILQVMPGAPGEAARSLNPARLLALTAAGAVKYLPDVSGIVEMISAMAKFPKAPGWNEDPETICQMRTQFMARLIGVLEQMLAPGNEAKLPGDSPDGGLIVDDFENNGRLDVVTSSPVSCDPMHFYHSNGDGTFTDRAA